MGINPSKIDDMQIYDIVEDLNKISFIQTHMCCRGHPLSATASSFSPYMIYYFQDTRGIELTETIYRNIIKDFKKTECLHITPTWYADKERYTDKTESKIIIMGSYKYHDGESTRETRDVREECVRVFWCAFGKGVREFKEKYDLYK